MKDKDFRLSEYLAADLRRLHLNPTTPAPTGLRLWVGLISPRFTPVLLYRLAYWLHNLNLGPLAKLLLVINFVAFGIEITARTRIGKGLFLPHTQATVIGAASIGDNAIIYNGVTIGAKRLDWGFHEEFRPVIGNDVLIGSGAKVLGPIAIGDGVKIGAMAVVMRSVSAGSIVHAPLGEVIPPAGHHS